MVTCKINYIAFIFWLLFILFFNSCQEEDYELLPASKSTLIYMVADNNLDYYAMDNIKKIEKSYPSDSNNDIYIYIDRSGNTKTNHPILMKITHDSISSEITSPILKTYRELDSCNPYVLKSVLNDVIEMCRGRNSSLKNIILWSHGTGWLPGASTQAASRSFGLDNTGENENIIQSEMDILDLKTIVFENHHFDVLIMDACFMGCIEFAFKIRDNFDYLILSPSEILATGFPYEEITSELVSDNINPVSIASKFYSHYNNQKNALKSASISVIKASMLDNLASLLNPVYQKFFHNNQSDFALLEIPQYDKGLSNYYFDLKAFVDFTMDKEFKKEFEEIWKKIVLYYAHTPFMYSTHSLENTNGLSLYIPNNYEKRIDLHNYYKKLSWAKNSGADIMFD